MKTQQEKLYKGFPYPKSNTQEVLLTLITKGHVSIFDYPYLSGFRTRVSELILVHGLNLEKKQSERSNKFGNNYRYTIHFLPESEKEKAISLYHKFVNNSN